MRRNEHEGSMNRFRTIPGESMNLQDRMDKAFEDYFAVTNELRSDVEMFLDAIDSGLLKESDIRWKRNFVRALVAVIEGHSYMLRQIAATELECKPQELSNNEQIALTSRFGELTKLPDSSRKIFIVTSTALYRELTCY